jgi:hypothetical protein
MSRQNPGATKEFLEMMEEVEQIEDSLAELLSRCYRLREKLGVVSTIPSSRKGVVLQGLSKEKKERLNQKYHRTAFK